MYYNYYILNICEIKIYNKYIESKKKNIVLIYVICSYIMRLEFRNFKC